MGSHAHKLTKELRQSHVAILHVTVIDRLPEVYINDRNILAQVRFVDSLHQGIGKQEIVDSQGKSEATGQVIQIEAGGQALTPAFGPPRTICGALGSPDAECVQHGAGGGIAVYLRKVEGNAGARLVQVSGHALVLAVETRVDPVEDEVLFVFEQALPTLAGYRSNGCHSLGSNDFYPVVGLIANSRDQSGLFDHGNLYGIVEIDLQELHYNSTNYKPKNLTLKPGPLVEEQ